MGFFGGYLSKYGKLIYHKDFLNSDEISKLRFRFLFVLNSLTLLAYCAFIPRFMISYSTVHSGIYGILFFGFALIATSLILQRYRGLYKTSAMLTVFGSYLNPTVMIFFTGGIESPAVFWIGVLPICASTVLGKRWALIGAFLSLTVMGSFVALGMMGPNYHYQVIPGVDEFIIERNMNSIVFVIVMAALTYMISYLTEKSLKMLRHKNRQIEELLRIVVHDLNNPITVLKSKVRQVERKKEFEQKDIQALNRSIVLMGNITETVRNLLLSTQSNSKSQFTQINLFEPLSRSIQNFEVIAEEKNIKIDFKASTEHAKIWGDEVIIHVQIFNNLISNAIKFAPEGSVITVQLSDEERDFKISIDDKGPGIDQEKLENIFDIWIGKSTEGTAGEKGTGFGLNIVKNFLEHFDARIEVKTSTDEVNHGTSFELYFPKSFLKGTGNRVLSVDRRISNVKI